MGSSVGLDALEKNQLSNPGNQKFLGCPGCILTHYNNYLILEGPSWNFNQDSEQSAACHVSLQAFQSKAGIEPQVKSSSTPSTPFSVHCLLAQSYFNVYISHSSLNYIIISVSFGFVSLQEQVQN
jgi:hypothetical protein